MDRCKITNPGNSATIADSRTDNREFNSANGKCAGASIEYGSNDSGPGKPTRTGKTPDGPQTMGRCDKVVQ